MPKQDTLAPVDIVLLLALASGAVEKDAPYANIARVLAISPSTAHQSVRRLRESGLLHAGTRDPNLKALRDFLVHGVRYAFPPKLGREARGVPTAHSAPPLKDVIDSEKPFVWPDVKGSLRGISLTPLYPKATTLPERSPLLYSVLTLLDACRVGQARERNAALDALDRALGMQAT